MIIAIAGKEIQMKLVLFTQRVDIIAQYHEKRDCADQRISEFIYYCGYLPIPVPNNINICNEMLRKLPLSGIVLTGGNSLVQYGGDSPEKDAIDRLLISWAVTNQVPLYGFCRGMQSVLDYFGYELVNVKSHVAVRHKIHPEGRSVNSFHNQGILEFPPNGPLDVLDKAEDGVVEAVGHKSYPIVATMWHPERENPFNIADKNRMINLFR